MNSTEWREYDAKRGGDEWRNSDGESIIDDLAASEAETRKAHDLLRNILDYYPDHDFTCSSTHGTGLPCDCGFDDLVVNIRALIGG